MTIWHHTPGPWHAEQYSRDAVLIVSPDRRVLVSTVHQRDASDNVDAANAQLIAQAPAMLVRLAGVCVTAANMLGEMNSGREIIAAVLRLEMENLLRDTQATIAKALR